jgi:signal transduction histidine kinase
MLRVFILLAIFCQAVTAVAGDWHSPLSLTDKGIVIAGKHGVSWAEGQRGNFLFDQFQSIDWKPLILPKDMKQGRTPIWYRFAVRNDTGTAENFILGSMEAHSSDFVIVYIERSDGSIEDLYSGSKLSPYLKTNQSASLDFPIKLQKNEEIIITIGISSVFSRNLLFKMLSDGANRAERIVVHNGVGVEFGLLIFAIIFNLLAWFTIKKTYNLIFALLSTISLFAQSIGLGYATLFFPNVFGPYGSEILIVAIASGVVLRTWFASEFLNIRSYSKRIAQLFNFFLILGIFMIALSSDSTFPTQSFMADYSSIVIIVTFPLAIFLGRTSKSLLPWMYLIALTFTTIGGKLWFDNFSGQQVPSTLGLHAFMIAGLFETVIMTLLFMADVSGIFKAAKESTRNKEEADRMGLLVQVLSHDLKNSTSIIQGAGEKILKDSSKEGHLTLLAKRIIDTVNRQFAMLTSVQNLVNLEKGSIKLDMNVVDLNQELLELQEFFQEKTSEKQLVILSTASHDQSAFILAEQESLLTSVLSNIFYNAIKFSPVGGTIFLRIESRPSGVRLSIEDKGIGMPPIMVDSLFQPAHLPSRPGTNGEPGSGFGLSICKAYMDMYNGSIEVSSRSKYDSPYDHGTIVTLEFRHAPQKAVAQLHLKKSNRAPKPSDLTTD